MINRSTLTTALKARGQVLGHRAGIHVALHSVRSSAELRRSTMLRTLGIDLIFDVGANAGQYGSLLRAGGFEGRIVSFEPQAAPRAELVARASSDSRWEVLATALGDEDGEAHINVAVATGASSLLETELRHLQEDPGATSHETEQVTVRRLDDVAATYLSDRSRVGVKLDVQGYEWHVLAGAPRLLTRADFVECEVLLAPYYEGQARVEDIVALMYENGLRIVGTDHGHVDESTGMVTWMDVVFARHHPAAAVSS